MEPLILTLDQSGLPQAGSALNKPSHTTRSEWLSGPLASVSASIAAAFSAMVVDRVSKRSRSWRYAESAGQRIGRRLRRR